MPLSRHAAVIAIHGGAGTIRKRDMTAARAALYRRALSHALESSYELLRKGASSLDAAIAAVTAMEDSPLFNAGRGAVYNAEGRHELDAAVMDGATLRAGAVTCVSRIRNPVLAARAVMERTRHVLLAGEAAERFAARNGIALVEPDYFSTPERRLALERNLKNHHGTVGAVALDLDGNLAAATSTGGFTAKLAGRVGDTPIVGAGTYADNETCAVSGTGLGEAFIRCVLAYDVSARMRYRGDSLSRAASAALARIARLGADGGLVAVDRRGNVAMPFNSQGMYRAAIDRRGKITVAIY